MNKFLFTISFISCLGFSQVKNNENSYNEIPKEFLNHPELKSSSYNTNLQESKYELVHLRTSHSKTFLNTNTTKTTIQSSNPIHYKDNKGQWLTLDYNIKETNEHIVFPIQQPKVLYNKNNKTLQLKNLNEDLVFKNEVNFVFINANNESIKTFKNNDLNPEVKNNKEFFFKDYLPNVDKKFTLYNQAIKSDYIIKNIQNFPNQFHKLIIEESIELPVSFTILEILNENKQVNQLLILDKDKKTAFTFNQPIITDNKVLNTRNKSNYSPYLAQYKVINLNDNKYKIQTVIDSEWLTSHERVFPIVIDPVVTINNNDVINSCIFPAYQQSTLQVNVPAGESILSSDIKYDFVATASSTAWMSEQRSFVSSVNGQTAVISGVGDSSGTYNYTINGSPIANSTSTGSVTYTFNFARNWGGSTCDATFQFVNKREVIVTYGTIVFGNGPIFLNEYSASNRSINDGFGRKEDWIEIYNANPTTYFNLNGYYMSNDAANPTKWQIQNGIIPPNSRVLVYCSKRGISSGTVLHANFNLKQLEPDVIVFANPTGTILEQLTMFTTQTNHSYGRSTDGGNTWKLFSNATPGAANSVGFDGYTTKPTFNVNAGRYQNFVTFTLASTGQNETIRYTTDGSTPTITSILYTAPVTLNATTVIRARTFSSNPNILPGFIETNTYFINENSTLPTFSFVGNPDLLELFNGNQNLEPFANFEYFKNDGLFVDENIGDFDKHGNDSWSYAQRGVDFTSRDDHGYKSELTHPFFATSSRTKFSRLMVKAAASDNYPFEADGAHIRDPFIQTLSQVANLNLDERSSTSISLFVNGQYWGVYDLRERVHDDDYTDFYYGQDTTFRASDIYLQFIKTWGTTQAEYGNQPAIDNWTTLRQFVQNNNMGIQANLDNVNSQLNLDSLIDYLVFNSYVVSRDWLNYNTAWWKGTDPSGDAKTWRYTLWDMDAALGHYTNFTGMPDVTATATPCQVENLNVGDGHTQTLKKLILENPSVRQKYVTRYADLLNTHLSCQKVTQLFDNMVATITPEMPRQIAKWGGNMTTWQANVQSARNFLTTRCAYLMNTGLANCYNLTGPYTTTFYVFPANAGKIKMNSEWLSTFPFNAQVFGNISTILKAEGNAGYIFSHWVVDGAVVTPNSQVADIVLQLSQATNVTAHFIDPSISGGDLLYYWNFNNLVTPQDVVNIMPDYKLLTTTNPIMTYTGSGPRSIDAVEEGNLLNSHQNAVAGKGARVRNPSDNRTLDFSLPTIGYKDIKFAYAIQRTDQGQLKNIVSYTIDGTNFIQNGLNTTEFDINTTYGLIQIDFSNITGVKNNPNFKIRISFQGNTTGSNGNNRLDNITLKGVQENLSNIVMEQTNFQVFPNPFTNKLQIISKEKIISLKIYDVLGKLVHNKSLNANETTIDLENLTYGLYLLEIYTDTGKEIRKIVKK